MDTWASKEGNEEQAQEEDDLSKKKSLSGTKKDTSKESDQKIKEQIEKDTDNALKKRKKLEDERKKQKAEAEKKRKDEEEKGRKKAEQEEAQKAEVGEENKPGLGTGKEYLVESFAEMVSNLKSEMDDLMSSKDFLNIFEGKDIVQHGAIPTKNQQILMHLYVSHLSEKNFDIPELPSTEFEYTRMYSKIVLLDWHISVLAGRGHQSSAAEEDWGTECNERCTDTPSKECTEVLPVEDEGTSLEEQMETHNITSEVSLSNRLRKFFSPLFTLWNIAIPYFFPNMNKPEVKDYEKLYREQIPKESALRYSHIAMCEYTLIQSADDLKCAETLLREAHYPQSVFMSSQSIEKCLKSLLGFHKCVFQFYINRHSATELVSHLTNHLLNKKDKYTPYAKYHDEFIYLCELFESLGHDSWTVDMPISIRSRYFNYQTDWDQPWESRFHYYVDSYPGVVFTQELAQTGYEIAQRIFEMSEIIHEENVESFEE